MTSSSLIRCNDTFWLERRRKRLLVTAEGRLKLGRQLQTLRWCDDGLEAIIREEKVRSRHEKSCRTLSELSHLRSPFRSVERVEALLESSALFSPPPPPQSSAQSPRLASCRPALQSLDPNLVSDWRDFKSAYRHTRDSITACELQQRFDFSSGTQNSVPDSDNHGDYGKGLMSAYNDVDTNQFNECGAYDPSVCNDNHYSSSRKDGIQQQEFIHLYNQLDNRSNHESVCEQPDANIALCHNSDDFTTTCDTDNSHDVEHEGLLFQSTNCDQGGCEPVCTQQSINTGVCNIDNLRDSQCLGFTSAYNQTDTEYIADCYQSGEDFISEYDRGGDTSCDQPVVSSCVFVPATSVSENTNGGQPDGFVSAYEQSVKDFVPEFNTVESISGFTPNDSQPSNGQGLVSAYNNPVSEFTSSYYNKLSSDTKQPYELSSNNLSVSESVLSYDNKLATSGDQRDDSQNFASEYIGTKTNSKFSACRDQYLYKVGDSPACDVDGSLEAVHQPTEPYLQASESVSKNFQLRVPSELTEIVAGESESNYTSPPPLRNYCQEPQQAASNSVPHLELAHANPTVTGPVSPSGQNYEAAGIDDVQHSKQRFPSGSFEENDIIAGESESNYKSPQYQNNSCEGSHNIHQQNPPKNWSDIIHEEQQDIVSPLREEQQDIVSPLREEQQDIVSPLHEEQQDMVSPLREEQQDPRQPYEVNEIVATETLHSDSRSFGYPVDACGQLPSRSRSGQSEIEISGGSQFKSSEIAAGESESNHKSPLFKSRSLQSEDTDSEAKQVDDHSWKANEIILDSEIEQSEQRLVSEGQQLLSRNRLLSGTNFSTSGERPFKSSEIAADESESSPPYRGEHPDVQQSWKCDVNPVTEQCEGDQCSGSASTERRTSTKRLEDLLDRMPTPQCINGEYGRSIETHSESEAVPLNTNQSTSYIPRDLRNLTSVELDEPHSGSFLLPSQSFSLQNRSSAVAKFLREKINPENEINKDVVQDTNKDKAEPMNDCTLSDIPQRGVAQIPDDDKLSEQSERVSLAILDETKESLDDCPVCDTLSEEISFPSNCNDVNLLKESNAMEEQSADDSDTKNDSNPVVQSEQSNMQSLNTFQGEEVMIVSIPLKQSDVISEERDMSNLQDEEERSLSDCVDITSGEGDAVKFLRESDYCVLVNNLRNESSNLQEVLLEDGRKSQETNLMIPHEMVTKDLLPNMELSGRQPVSTLQEIVEPDCLKLVEEPEIERASQHRNQFQLSSSGNSGQLDTSVHSFTTHHGLKLVGESELTLNSSQNPISSSTSVQSFCVPREKVTQYDELNHQQNEVKSKSWHHTSRSYNNLLTSSAAGLVREIELPTDCEYKNTSGRQQVGISNIKSFTDNCNNEVREIDLPTEVAFHNNHQVNEFIAGDLSLELLNSKLTQNNLIVQMKDVMKCEHLLTTQNADVTEMQCSTQEVIPFSKTSDHQLYSVSQQTSANTNQNVQVEEELETSKQNEDVKEASYSLREEIPTDPIMRETNQSHKWKEYIGETDLTTSPTTTEVSVTRTSTNHTEMQSFMQHSSQIQTPFGNITQEVESHYEGINKVTPGEQSQEVSEKQKNMKQTSEHSIPVSSNNEMLSNIVEDGQLPDFGKSVEDGQLPAVTKETISTVRRSLTFLDLDNTAEVLITPTDCVQQVERIEPPKEIIKVSHKFMRSPPPPDTTDSSIFINKTDNIRPTTHASSGAFIPVSEIFETRNTSTAAIIKDRKPITDDIFRGHKHTSPAVGTSSSGTQPWYVAPHNSHQPESWSQQSRIISWDGSPRGDTSVHQQSTSLPDFNSRVPHTTDLVEDYQYFDKLKRELTQMYNL